MPSLLIQHPGAMTSIQDVGRKGMLYYAIPRSGALDSNAAKQALNILHLPTTTALIECTSSAPSIKFQDSTQIVLTGADFSWTINGSAIQLNTIYTIQEGDVLKGGYAKNGLRGYLVINGTIEAQQVYGSASTYVNAKIGGYQGRFLQKGDRIHWTALPVETQHSIPIPLEIPTEIPIYPGPEYSYLSKAARSYLVEQAYAISPDSNRMGIRLKGKPLPDWDRTLTNSRPILPGFIQLPPSGMPIILLQDAQITGGYPRIAFVPEEYLSALNQIPHGKSFTFYWHRST